ncbi:hypothetical protein QTN25_006954 [Entamoeba marina]
MSTVFLSNLVKGGKEMYTVTNPLRRDELNEYATVDPSEFNIADIVFMLPKASNNYEIITILSLLLRRIKLVDWLELDTIKLVINILPFRNQQKHIVNLSAEVYVQMLFRSCSSFFKEQFQIFIQNPTPLHIQVLYTLYDYLLDSTQLIKRSFSSILQSHALQIIQIMSTLIITITFNLEIANSEELLCLNESMKLFARLVEMVSIPKNEDFQSTLTSLFTQQFLTTLQKLGAQPQFSQTFYLILKSLAQFNSRNNSPYTVLTFWIIEQAIRLSYQNNDQLITIYEQILYGVHDLMFLTPDLFSSLEYISNIIVSTINSINFEFVLSVLATWNIIHSKTNNNHQHPIFISYVTHFKTVLTTLCSSLLNLQYEQIIDLQEENCITKLVNALSISFNLFVTPEFLNSIANYPFWYYIFSSAFINTSFTSNEHPLHQIVFASLQKQPLSLESLKGALFYLTRYTTYRSTFLTEYHLPAYQNITFCGISNETTLDSTLILLERCCIHEILSIKLQESKIVDCLVQSPFLNFEKKERDVMIIKSICSLLPDGNVFQYIVPLFNRPMKQQIYLIIHLVHFVQDIHVKDLYIIILKHLQRENFTSEYINALPEKDQKLIIRMFYAILSNPYFRTRFPKVKLFLLGDVSLYYPINITQIFLQLIPFIQINKMKYHSMFLNGAIVYSDTLNENDSFCITENILLSIHNSNPYIKYEAQNIIERLLLFLKQCGIDGDITFLMQTLLRICILHQTTRSHAELFSIFNGKISKQSLRRCSLMFDLENNKALQFRIQNLQERDYDERFLQRTS